MSAVAPPRASFSCRVPGCSECGFPLLFWVSFLVSSASELVVKVAGVGPCKSVERLLRSSCSYFLCCEERLEAVAIRLASCSPEE